MTTPETVADIAAKLDTHQRDAICGRYSWPTIVAEDEGEAKLYRLGLWRRNAPWGKGAMTSLGKQVREYLERNRP